MAIVSNINLLKNLLKFQRISEKGLGALFALKKGNLGHNLNKNRLKFKQFADMGGVRQ